MALIKMLFAGFGGQGVLFSGKVAAHAALLDGRELSWLPSYGPEMRGGTANCSVCIDDKPIGSPLALDPTILLAFSPPAFEKFIYSAEPGALVFYDADLIEPPLAMPGHLRFFAVKATGLAVREGLEGKGNSILLGKMLKETQFSSFASVSAAMRQCIPLVKERLLEENLRAVLLGMQA